MNLKHVHEDDDFYYCLQRYSALYRIILARPYLTTIYVNKWNRIDLKLVNEFGLTLKGEQKENCKLEVSCKLLCEYDTKVRLCEEFNIDCRPLQHDAWEFNSADIAGFQNNTEGDFEYMVTIKDEKLSPISNQKFYLQIYPTTSQSIKALPLMIGPLYVFDREEEVVVATDWKEPDTSKDIFHGYRLHDNTYLIIQEDWNLGTPGKMWDSALVLSHLLNEKIMQDPTCFDGKRLLDLSAGTGCVGLLIASIYKINNHRRPDIIMTDLPEALDLIYQNTRQNHLEDFTDIKPLEWGNHQDVQCVLQNGPIHTIIASDVLYKPSTFPSLVETLDWLSRDNQEIQIYLGYKRRGLDLKTEQSFFDICGKTFYIQLLTTSKNNKNEGWIFNELSDICKETGVNLYQLVRK